jgi:hypothetical protein
VTAHPVTSRNGRAPETARRSRPAGFAGIADGPLVGFVARLDQIQQAAPTVNRRITGVTVTARARVPMEAGASSECTTTWDAGGVAVREPGEVDHQAVRPGECQFVQRTQQRSRRCSRLAGRRP